MKTSSPPSLQDKLLVKSARQALRQVCKTSSPSSLQDKLLVKPARQALRQVCKTSSWSSLQDKLLVKSARQALCQVCKTSSLPSLQDKPSIKSANHFKSVNLIKYSVIHELHAKPTFYPYHSFPLISLMSVHTLSKQGNTYISYITNHFAPSSFKATRSQHKLPSSHYNKLHHYLVKS